MDNNLYDSANLRIPLPQRETAVRVWQTIPLLEKDSAYSCEIPGDTTAYLFEMIGDAKDEEKVVCQSASVYFIKNNAR